MIDFYKIIIGLSLAALFPQIIKIITESIKSKQFRLSYFFLDGGMPSSHSAFVVALATIIYLQEGVSTAFAISLVLALIIIRDAFGVRRTVGKEGQAIQKLLKLHKIKSKFHFAMGHSPLQVLVGSALGFVIALLAYFI